MKKFGAVCKVIGAICIAVTACLAGIIGFFIIQDKIEEAKYKKEINDKKDSCDSDGLEEVSLEDEMFAE